MTTSSKRGSDLRAIYDLQRRFNERFFAENRLDLDRLSAAEVATWTKEFVVCVEDELHELLRQTSWKLHRRSNSSPAVRSNVLEEWVDALKFLLGLAQVWGFEVDEIVEEFERKSAVVEFRWQMERRLSVVSTARAVVAVDLDGVLNDYPRDFCEWVAQQGLGPKPAGDATCASLAAVREALGPRRYLEVKDAYRESGAKREQRVREGAKRLLDVLRAAGLTVVLLSRRPYWRFSRIYADTLAWLDANDLRVDAVLFHPEKHRKLLEDFPEVVAVVEDDPAVAREILATGTPVVLVEGELNAGVEVAGATRVRSPDAAAAFISVPER